MHSKTISVLRAAATAFAQHGDTRYVNICRAEASRLEEIYGLSDPLKLLFVIEKLQQIIDNNINVETDAFFPTPEEGLAYRDTLTTIKGLLKYLNIESTAKAPDPHLKFGPGGDYTEEITLKG